MRLGLNLVRGRPDRLPALAEQAETLGYESVFVPDHVVVPVSFSSKYPGTPDGSFPYPKNTPLYDPWTVLAAIGRATSRIRLGTAVYILALRHPIVTARHAVTLEQLVGPRLLLGIGVGWLVEEFTALGLEARSRFSRTEECATALRRLWTGSSLRSTAGTSPSTRSTSSRSPAPDPIRRSSSAGIRMRRCGVPCASGTAGCRAASRRMPRASGACSTVSLRCAHDSPRTPTRSTTPLGHSA